MKLPKMILFDYAGTIVTEKKFILINGTKELMNYVVHNPRNLTPDEIQKYATEINKKIDRKKLTLQNIEVPFLSFFKILYGTLDISFSLPPEQLELAFWNNAAPTIATPGIHMVLEAAKQAHIRTAVLCNSCFSEQAIRHRINKLIPENEFEWIISSSEVILQKPSKEVFQLALSKASLSASDVWYCGDSIREDIEGPDKVGIYPVWYNPRNLYFSGCNYLNVTDFSQLSRILIENNNR